VLIFGVCEGAVIVAFIGAAASKLAATVNFAAATSQVMGYVS
jgi:hypothetical protein